MSMPAMSMAEKKQKTTTTTEQTRETSVVTHKNVVQVKIDYIQLDDPMFS